MRHAVVGNKLILELDEQDAEYLFHLAGRQKTEDVMRLLHEKSAKSVRKFKTLLWDNMYHGYYTLRGHYSYEGHEGTR